MPGCLPGWMRQAAPPVSGGTAAAAEEEEDDGEAMSTTDHAGEAEVGGEVKGTRDAWRWAGSIG